MGFRVVADFSLCKSNAVCMATAPEVFEVDDRGYLTVLMPEPDEAMRELVERAVDACPTQALRIED